MEAFILTIVCILYFIPAILGIFEVETIKDFLRRK
jgi:hypothetical protein